MYLEKAFIDKFTAYGAVHEFPVLIAYASLKHPHLRMRGAESKIGRLRPDLFLFTVITGKYKKIISTFFYFIRRL